MIEPSENATVVEDTVFVTITSFDPENCDPLEDALPALNLCIQQKISKLGSKLPTESHFQKPKKMP